MYIIIIIINAHIEPHIDYASVVWDRRRTVKLILPDTTLTTDQKLKEMRIISLQKQLEYNKGLFMCRVLNNEAPGYISNLYTHIPSRYSNSRNYHLSLSRPRIDIFKTSVSFSVFIYGTIYL